MSNYVIKEDILNLIKRNNLVAELGMTFSISNEEKEIATTLIKDGWYGTFEELLECSRRLSK